MAAEAAGAFVEAFQDWIQPGVPIPVGEIIARRQSELLVPRTLTVADCTASQALAYGVTGEIHSGIDRARTQEWAAAFAAAGFDGVRYFVRHDPGQRQVGIALFGSGGDAAWPATATEPIRPELIRDVERVFGVQVR